MVAKVSPIEVFKETIALIRYRIKFISGMFFIMFLATTTFDWQMVQLEIADDFELSPVFFMYFLFSMVVGTVVQICGFNNFIQTLRSKSTPLIPHELVSKFFVTLFKEILFLLIIVIPGITVVIAFSVVTILIAPVVGGGVGGDVVAMLFSFLGMVLGFGVLGVRLGAGIAAAAMGEKMSFKHSWRMTRGYTFALVGFTLPFFFLTSFSQILISLELDSSVSFFSSAMVVIMILINVTYWFIYTAFSVWYEKLRLRYDEIDEVRRTADMP